MRKRYTGTDLDTGLPGSARINFFWFPLLAVANVVGLPEIMMIGRVISGGGRQSLLIGMFVC